MKPAILAAITAAMTILSCPAFADQKTCGGELRIANAPPDAPPTCPLEHTAVDADINGFIARVTVRQVFSNPLNTKIEAIYVFPLSQNAAVDHMVMEVGDRRIIGKVLERSEAREVYEQAVAAGHVAGLLDQERPNIFTQSVANIEPGAKVVIEISYVEVLKYEDGDSEFVFPMVVGPRYIPGGGSQPAPMTTGKDTPQVPDGSKITPPVIPEGMRAGHDVSIRVKIASGDRHAGPNRVHSDTHPVQHRGTGAPGEILVELQRQQTIPNRDFVLRYRLGADQIREGYFVSQTPFGNFFTLILQPPQRVAPAELMPRELIFVLDTSGSMHGYPIEKAKEVMSQAIDAMRPGDTFNLITFAGQTRILWEAPRPNTPENRAEAQALLAMQRGGGGTEMMKAIEAALVVGRSGWSGTERASTSPPPIRIVMFLTDGYVGNDMAIIDAVKKNAGTTRVFSFGIGSSVNRFLLDGMAREGRGEVEYVLLESQADAAVERFHERIAAPVLTDISLDWGDLPVADVYPQRVPDLFSAKPIVVHGRLTSAAGGIVTLRGNTGAGPYEERIQLRAPMTAAPPSGTGAGANGEATDSVVGAPGDDAGLLDAHVSLWARARVDDLMSRDWQALQSGSFPPDLKQQIIDLGVQFRLLTQFTSFVAVEEMRVTVGGEPTTIQVPVEMPAGVSYEGIFGADALVLGQPVAVRGGRMSGGFGGVAGQSKRTAGSAAKSPAPARLRLEAEAAPAESARDESDDQKQREPGVTPESKLAAALRDLRAKLAQSPDAAGGTATIDGIRIVNWRVDVIVSLSDASQETLAALNAVGFEQTAESKAARMLVGTIDIRKLEELARIVAVTSVRPIPHP